jgi:hypothetical protein
MNTSRTNRSEKSGYNYFSTISMEGGKMSIYFEHDRKIFKKSSFSFYSGSCVGVSISDDKVYIINTNTKDSIVEFTKEEWDAFIRGVKNSEFDED